MLEDDGSDGSTGKSKRWTHVGHAAMDGGTTLSPVPRRRACIVRQDLD